MRSDLYTDIIIFYTFLKLIINITKNNNKRKS